ncbi:MAG: hypothetical protein E7Z67_06140 [Thermoplasmata archaeon]|nr:hypothetical protein [Thermoplasmata archaeon]
MNPSKTERQSTVGAAIGILLIVVAIVGAIVVLVMNPEILDSIVWALVIIGGAILVVALGITLVAMFLILPMYAKKGVVYQTDMSYGVDDVQGVDGKMNGKD